MNRRSEFPLVVLGMAMVVAGMVAGVATGQSLSEPKLPPDLATYTHVNSLVVPDSDSPLHGMHHFYANKSARAVLEAGGAENYPDQSIFVGKVYSLVETDEGRYQEGDLVAYTLMRKASGAKETQETGGWRFAMLDSEGNPKDIDPVADCFECHRPHADTDFVLSEPLR